jgi:hypothetical protein
MRWLPAEAKRCAIMGTLSRHSNCAKVTQALGVVCIRRSRRAGRPNRGAIDSRQASSRIRRRRTSSVTEQGFLPNTDHRAHVHRPEDGRRSPCFVADHQRHAGGRVVMPAGLKGQRGSAKKGTSADGTPTLVRCCYCEMLTSGAAARPARPAPPDRSRGGGGWRVRGRGRRFRTPGRRPYSHWRQDTEP